MRTLLTFIVAPMSFLSCSGKEDDTGDADVYNPEITDSDGDGLMDAEELRLGTDPNNPDTDGDGFTDGYEVEQGTNPLYVYSRPYIGGWEVGNCEDGEPTPTGPRGQSTDPSGAAHAIYQVGDVAYNFTFQDQNEEHVSLFSFCGHSTMLVFVRTDIWRDNDLEDRQEMMMQLTYVQQTWAGFGFQVVVVVLKNYDGIDPVLNDSKQLSSLIQSSEPNMPVLVITPDQATLQGIYAHYEKDWIYPTIVHLDPYMNVLSVDQDKMDPCEFIPGATC